MAFTRFTASSLTTGVAKYIDADAGRTPIPSVPTIGTATDGGTGSTVSVAFTPGYYAGTYYTATSSPGSITATSNTSPITVSGLTAGTAYTFTVTATNGTGTSAASAASNSVTPANPSSFESIATVTGNGSSATLTFSNIPSTFSHLQIRGTGYDGPNGMNNIGLRLNGDSTSIYDSHYLVGGGSSASVSALNNISRMWGMAWATSDSNMLGATIIDIHDYASTTKNKTARALTGYDMNNSSGAIYLVSGLWRSTAAVTSVSLIDLGGVNFEAGTKFALYGIKGA